MPCPHIDLRDVSEAGSCGARAGVATSVAARGAARSVVVRTWTRLDASNLDLLDDFRDLHELLWQSRGRRGVFDDRRIAFREVATGMRGPEGLWLQRIGDVDRAVAAQLAAVRVDPVLLRHGTGPRSPTWGWASCWRRGGSSTRSIRA